MYGHFIYQYNKCDIFIKEVQRIYYQLNCLIE